MPNYLIRTILYILASWLFWQGATLLEVAPNVSAFYPVAGLTIAFIAAFGWRYLPAVILGLILHIFPDVMVWELAITDWLQLARQLLIYGTAGLIIRHFSMCNLPLRTITNTGYLLVIILASSLASAFIANQIFMTFAVFPTVVLTEIFFSFWAGDASGAIMAAPIAAIVIEATRRSSLLDITQTLKLISANTVFMVFLLPVASGFFVFGFVLNHEGTSNYHYLIILPIVWAAASGGIKGGIFSALFANLGSVIAYQISGAVTHPAVDLQVLFAFTAAVGLIIGAIVDDRNQISQSEEHSQRLNKALNEAQHVARMGSWEVDLQTIEQNWSEENFRLFEFPLDQGQPSFEAFLERVHPDDRHYFTSRLSLVLKGTNATDIEFRNVRNDGSIRILLSKSEIIYDEDGKPCRLIGTCHDITEQKHKEEADNRLHAAIDELSELVSIFDSEDRLVFANKNFLNINNNAVKIGMRYEDLLLLGLNNNYFPEAIGREDEWLNERMANHLTATGPVEVERQDGITLQINDQVLPDGGIVTIASDITERKQMEKDLRASEARLQGILTIAPEAVIVIGQRHNIRHFNHGAERMFGYTSDEMLGQSLNKLLPPHVRDIHTKHIEEFEQSSDDFRLMDSRSEVSAVRKDGSTFPATASLSKFEVNDETIFVAMLHDITERKQAETDIIASKEEAEIANRAKSEFLANMSHELRSPLNAILGFSGMITNEVYGPLKNPKYFEYATDIHSAGTHLLQVIGDILDISKIEAGQATLEETEIDVISSVIDCIAMMKPRSDEAMIKVATDIPTHLPALYADGRHLKQIMINILSNAIKFTPVDGEIMASVRLNESSVLEIMVSDTGCGIPPNDIPKVLLPFGQVAASQTRNHEGTGLGLPICKSLMELHGGTLDIESNVGVGTTIIIKFPAERTIQA